MNNLKTLLDRVYELEGLIHLALSRTDSESKENIARLIAAKGEAVSRALAAFEETAVAVDASAPEGPDPLAEAEELISYSIEEEEESSEVPADSTPSETYDQPESSGSEETPAPEEDTRDIPVTQENSLASDSDNIPDNSDNDNSDKTESSPRRLRSLFTINDRFRFARELFGGSTRRLDDSLTYLDVAIDFNEVEDFFLTEQGLDPDSEVTREFLEILSRAFAD